MPSEEGRRRQREAELYRQTEQRKREEDQRAAQERLRGFHRNVERRMQERQQRLKEIREQFGLNE